ncbi:MAG: Fe-S cluster assembly ATPase SufC [Microthrixaceae bacterium]
MLSIQNLTASVLEDTGTADDASAGAGASGNQILRGIDLEIGPGEVHAIMGPNGSGKSTLSNVLTGREGYEVTGKVLFDGADLLSMDPEERAAAGLFLAFQYPVEIPGVGNMYFLRTAVNAVRTARGEPELSATQFLSTAREAMADLEMDPAFLSRSVNAGFSGGEKKRNEVLQMTLLQPRLAILDETDSGLDIDALRIVAQGIEKLRSPERSMLIITHYPRLLEYVQPDRVHVLRAGRIVREGGPELAHELEEMGYGPQETGPGGAGDNGPAGDGTADDAGGSGSDAPQARSLL